MPPPALLLHGFLGRGADWNLVAERLAATRRVLAPDWLDEALGDARARPDRTGDQGAGVSDRGAEASARGVEARGRAEEGDAEPFAAAAPRRGGLAWAADRLAERLDAAGIDRADVAGYSMGGRLALLFAVRHPERVRRLVLVSASPGLKTPEERAARRAHDAVLARDLAADFPAFLARWTRQPVFASLSDAQRDAIEQDRAAHVDPERAARALVAMGTGAMPSLWEPLRSLRVETHAVAGALDPKYAALATSEAIVAAGVRATILPDAGHALLTEAPGALADLLIHLFA